MLACPTFKNKIEFSSKLGLFHAEIYVILMSLFSKASMRLWVFFLKSKILIVSIMLPFLFNLILNFVFLQIYEGTAQIQRIIIGREWLGIAKQKALI